MPTYRRVLHALDPELERHPAVLASGGLGPFAQGLYGCSEMINEGFKRLVEVGVIRRKVVDKEAADAAHRRRQRQRARARARSNATASSCTARSTSARRRSTTGCATSTTATRRGIGMKRVSEVNELYGGNESLERLQRREARFFNTCMMATALGAAVSDGLDDGRVVSGVGGQYNFVAMAHALPDARSALLLRATRDAAGKSASNIRWNYGHTTIPRHLRDLYISEYGIADVRGLADEDCVRGDGRHRRCAFPGGVARRRRSGDRSCAADFSAARGLAHAIRRCVSRAALAPFRADGTLPDYPLGSDFTEVEQRLVKALGWLKANTATPRRQVAHGACVRSVRGLARIDEIRGWRMARNSRIWRGPSAMPGVANACRPRCWLCASTRSQSASDRTR